MKVTLRDNAVGYKLDEYGNMCWIDLSWRSIETDTVQALGMVFYEGDVYVKCNVATDDEYLTNVLVMPENVIR